MMTIEAIKELKTLILSYHTLLLYETSEEERVEDLVTKSANDLGIPLCRWSNTKGFLEEKMNPLAQETLSAQDAIRFMHMQGRRSVFLLKDFSVFLDSPGIVRSFRELIHKLQSMNSTVVLVTPKANLPPEIEHLALAMEIHLPTRDDLRNLIKSVGRDIQMQQKARVISVQLSPHEGDQLLNALSGMTLKQCRQVLAYCFIENGRLDAHDIALVLERKVQMLKNGGILDFYPVESNHYEIGGFTKLKNYLETTKIGFSEEARKLNLPLPKGILIVGVPGCGKSLAAKFIARHWQYPLLKLDAGRLFDKFIGESEKNFRKAILASESMAPSILWIDEIEKAMSGANSGDDSDSGLSKRLFGAFLTWLQEKKKNVFVVATANNLSLLPPELLRKGRFDEIFFVDLPTHHERKEILGIHLKLKKQQVSQIDVEKVAQTAADFSGAELEQIVITSILKALKAQRPLQTDDLLYAIQQTLPLAQSRKEEIDSLRQQGKAQYVSVN